ncbi:unnamed protein product [Coregonus sp. 'balchen']|nr:unnamed protein product [Coregonus sp. 'balchen']
MAKNANFRAIPRIGITNAVTFAWKEKDMEPFGRETFGRTLLMGVLKLAVKDVMCLQANPLEGAYDVVLHTEGKHDEVMKKAREVEKARPMCHYEVTSLAKNNFRVITVNMYNPHVKDEEVRAFMGRYMDNVSSARLLKDSLGFWNGKRSFQDLLREDPMGLGGYLHPPALWADMGTLLYACQPPFCRRCMAYGHNFASCGEKKCRVCGSEAHEARDCDESKKCHGCMQLQLVGEQGQKRGMEEEEEEEFQTQAQGQKQGGEGGPKWGESEMSRAQGDEVREMMEELVIKGGWVSPLPASPKKRGKRRGRSSDRKREMGGYCKRKKREERRDVDHIQRLLELELEAGNLCGSVDWERSSALKAQLREVHERKACAFLERAHSGFLEHDETYSTVFFKLVRGRQSRKVMYRVREENGRVVRETEEIVKVTTEHFRGFFKKGQ